jgi:hypothetical protein
MKTQRGTRALNIIAALLIVAASTPSAYGMQKTEQFRFRVLLDDKEIGYHDFTVTSQGKREVVESRAEFDVRLLFVPVYSYRHQNTEVWHDGCLTRIRARTDDNGKNYDVRGELGPHSFQLVTQDDTQSLSRDCVMTFAYWRRDFLKQPRLLNSQTGELIEVEVQPLEDVSYSLPSGAVQADGYRIRARHEELDIRVWYARDGGKWLALESTVKGGRTLTYLPKTTAGQVLARNEQPGG